MCHEAHRSRKVGLHVNVTFCSRPSTCDHQHGLSQTPSSELQILDNMEKQPVSPLDLRHVPGGFSRRPKTQPFGPDLQVRTSLNPTVDPCSCPSHSLVLCLFVPTANIQRHAQGTENLDTVDH